MIVLTGRGAISQACYRHYGLDCGPVDVLTAAVAVEFLQNLAGSGSSDAVNQQNDNDTDDGIVQVSVVFEKISFFNL